MAIKPAAWLRLAWDVGFLSFNQEQGLEPHSFSPL
jgi:hypothetical protein